MTHHSLTTIQSVHRWLETQKRETSDGITWLTHSSLEPQLQNNLYYGGSGIILFYIQAHKATGTPYFLDIARSAGDRLISELPEELTVVEASGSGADELIVDQNQPGLYLGLSGVAYALAVLYKYSGDLKYSQAAQNCVALLRTFCCNAFERPKSTLSSDISSGLAGILLTFMSVTKLTGQADLADFIANAAAMIFQKAIINVNEVCWNSEDDEEYLHPNFAYGTAGIGYFYASLYGVTGEEHWLNIALAAERYLHRIANNDGSICHTLGHHHSSLYYLGWCHGPAGTARLYWQLWRTTQNDTWLSHFFQNADILLESGIPNQNVSGFWNNLSYCCGNAGVIEFLLIAYITGLDRKNAKADKYFDLASRLVDDILSKSEMKEGGLYWPQAENRIEPEVLLTPTGYMQGAAGICSVLLFFESCVEAEGDIKMLGKAVSKHIWLPDSPFADLDSQAFG